MRQVPVAAVLLILCGCVHHVRADRDCPGVCEGHPDVPNPDDDERPVSRIRPARPKPRPHVAFAAVVPERSAREETREAIACARVLSEATEIADAELLGALDRVDDARAGECGRRVREISCALKRGAMARGGPAYDLTRRCFALRPDPALDAKAHLIVAALSWKYASWIEIAEQAGLAFAVTGAEDVAITALENAILGSSCEPDRIRRASVVAARFAAHDHHDSSFAARIDALASMTHEDCATLHQP